MFPNAYIEYLIHFHGDRDYFECHEVLEEYWKETDPGNKRSIWVGLIQFAVSSYHFRRRNLAGALRTLEKAAEIIAAEREKCTNLGIDYIRFMELLSDRRNEIITQQTYQSVNIPIADTALLQTCKVQCERLGYVWGSKSNLADKQLISRHSLRDRTDVIMERHSALKARQRKKGQ
ncbi:DUF309 domain-containing protein [Mesobacillus foraminis]|uniref:DUF309 domain-containing protein n=1 Tax=Mesobacillus foraminis TaxID=279826 RepID=UPI001BED268E|nr:DUF309 domain-containing protein [Mesobacillus foraminis]MBT2754853.1 DUF309 domain-containing protein [Mesobacillus foraminis]